MCNDNIKEALKYAVDLSEGQEVIYHENEKTWVDTDKATLRPLEPIRYAETLTVNTLTGLVDYLKSCFDKHEADEKLLVNIESPTEVVVYSKLNSDRKRESIVKAAAVLDRFPYGKFMDSEKFIINIQSLFKREKDAEAILKCASAIRIEGGGDLKDDGISQQVTVKHGATAKVAEVPSPAVLIPYRTFLEVDQPDSQFVFRIDKDGDCALFEADGGMWKYNAKESIDKYLNEQLGEEIEQGYLTIIS